MKRLVSLVAYALAAFVILLALLVLLGRLLSPMVSQYREPIVHYLSEQLDADIQLAAIDANWQQLSLTLTVRDLVIDKHSEEYKRRVLSVDNAQITIDLLDSLTQWRLAMREAKLNGVELSLEQNQQGGWAILGFQQAKATPQSIDPADWFLQSDQVKLANARIRTYFYQGQTTEVDISSITIANDHVTQFRRLEAVVGVVNQPSSLAMVLEGVGDPRDPDFLVTGFLRLREFSAERFLTFLPYPKLAESITQQHALSRLNLDVWLTRTQPDRVNINGYADFLLPSIQSADALINVDVDVSSRFNGFISLNSGFSLSLRDLQLYAPEQPVTVSKAILSSDDFTHIRLTTEGLALKPLSDWLGRPSRLPEPWNRVFPLMNVAGHLDYLDVQLDMDDLLSSQLLAKAHNVSFGTGDKIPAVTGLSGYFMGTLAQGAIVAKASHSSFTLTPIFSEPIPIHQAQGQVNWTIDPAANLIAIHSHRIKATSDFGMANAYMLLDLPLIPDSREPSLTLAIGAQHPSLEYYRPFLPARLMPASLNEWLLGSIQGGDIDYVGILFRGELSQQPEASQTFQLYGQVANGALTFDSAWPALTNIDGHVILNNSEFNAQVSQAKTAGIELSNVEVYWPGQWQSPPLRLHIEGQAHGVLPQAINFAQWSPVHTYIDYDLASWSTKGRFNTELSLALGILDGPTTIDLSTQLSNAEITNKDVPLELTKINGNIRYHSDEGYFAQSITAELFDQPITVNINSEDAATLIQWDGTFNPSMVTHWLDKPALDIFKGQAPYQASVSHSREDNTLAFSVTSSLEGLALNLPSPLQKPKDAAWPLLIEGYTQGHKIDLSASIDDRVFMGKHSSHGYYLTVNHSPPTYASTASDNNSRVHIKASLPTLNMDEWQTVLATLTSKSSTPKRSFDWPIDATINADRLIVAGNTLDHVNASYQAEKDHHAVAIISNQIVGQLNQSGTDPWAIHLERLYWNNTKSEGDNISESATTFDDLPAMDVRIDQLFVNNLAMGQWQFSSSRRSGKWSIQPIVANLPGNLTLTFIDGARPASVVWQKDTNTTRATGRLMGGNLEPFLQGLGIEKSIINEETTIDIQLSWPGSPQDFDLKLLAGEVDVNLLNGRFLQTSGASSTDILRLAGLLNFDTWARRLRLDFSDLYKEGLAFDQVSGRVQFDKGQALLGQGINVTGPSSQLLMTGNINLNQQTLDMQLRTTLPVTGNLAFVTAFAAGLPAAASVYALGKIFEKDMAKVTSLTYNITGSWSNPEISSPPKAPIEEDPYAEFGR